MYILLALFTTISATVSVGYSVNACYTTKETNAYYAFARSITLFLVSIFTFIIINNTFLITIAIIMILIQFLDGLIGWANNEKLKFFGPLLTSLVNLIILILFIL